MEYRLAPKISGNGHLSYEAHQNENGEYAAIQITKNYILENEKFIASETAGTHSYVLKSLDEAKEIARDGTGDNNNRGFFRAILTDLEIDYNS